MEYVAEQLQLIGDQLTEFGFWILPTSFISFFILRALEHLWKKVILSRLVKGIWYLANGIMTIIGHVNLETLVAFVLIIESIDLYFDFLNRKKELKEQQKRGEKYKNIKIT